MKKNKKESVIEYDDRTPGKSIVIAGRFLVYLMFFIAAIAPIATTVMTIKYQWQPAIIIIAQAFFASVGIVISAMALLFFISILDSLHVQIKLLSVLIEKDQDV